MAPKSAFAAATFALLSSVSGLAIRSIPSSELAPEPTFECGPNQLYVVEKNGRTRYWPVPTRFGNNTGCIDKSSERLALEARQQEFDTFVQTSDDLITASDYTRGTAGPAVYTQLWDGIIDAACSRVSSECRGSLTVDNNAGDIAGGRIQMSVEGEWPVSSGTTLRDQLFQLAREAFDRAVVSRTGGGFGIDPGRHEDAPELLIADAGNTQNGRLRIEFNDQLSSTWACPEVVQRINSLGALVPGLGQVFGIAGAVCQGF